MGDTTGLRAPFPWFGGKSLAAPVIWRAFGNVPNYVEPFAGSLAVLLARPSTPKIETVNDKDGFVANFWRATAAAPAEVARWADWPVNEADLHARHRWLVDQSPLLGRLIADPDWYDARIAGWWVWGISTWIGNGWCSKDERLHRCLPKVGAPGHGIHARHRKMPRNARGATGLIDVDGGVRSLSAKKPKTNRATGTHRVAGAELAELFEALSERLRRVRVCCGDWSRVTGRSTLGIDTDTAHGMSPCGVLLDPPYDHEGREKRLYREDVKASLSADVRAWALEHGDNPQLRIALCGWEGEHEMPPTWTKVAWVSKGSGKNRDRERIWFSPYCLQVETQGDLFTRLEVAHG